jgi:hypothetical protein
MNLKQLLLEKRLLQKRKEICAILTEIGVETVRIIGETGTAPGTKPDAEIYQAWRRTT